LLKRRLTPVGKEVFGPAFSAINRKRFLYSFSGLL
jgi:hypothetical protein